MFDDFNDMQSLFATEDDIFEGQMGAILNEQCSDFKNETQFRIENFFGADGPFESQQIEAGSYKFKIYATKNHNETPFLDLKVILENPPIAPQKIIITLSVLNKIDKDNTYSLSQTTSLSRSFAQVYFTNFVSLESLLEIPGYLDEDSLMINVSLSSISSDSIWGSSRSRELFGYVGLQNQGATCYMNSMLQMLFHIPAFRYIVYDMPTSDVADPQNSIPLQLQRLFYNLQFSLDSVTTKDLTDSFGWRTQDIMVQHDVQEFNRVLIANLESKLLGTDLEKGISSIFQGRNRSVIRCVNIDHTSYTENVFSEIQLTVCGNSNLAEAFSLYLTKDRLEGNNQCSIDGFGKQDADIGIEIIEMPPVLQLHLNRFTYDFEKEMIVKVNDYFEYPEEIDMAPFINDCTESQIYDLVGVLVHSGTSYSGHYYAYIRPEPQSDWLEFNDSFVKKARKEDVFDNNFGQKENNDDNTTVISKPKQKKPKFQKRNQRMKVSTSAKKKRTTARKPIPIQHSAYLLVYVRRSSESSIYHPANEGLPSHLHDYFERLTVEQEIRRQEMLEKIYCADIEVVTEDQLALPDTCCFSVPENMKHKISLNLQAPVSQALELVRDTLHLDHISLWQCGAYGNPVKYLDPTYDTPIGHFVSRTSVLFAFNCGQRKDDDIFIFIKQFDPQSQIQIKYNGCHIYNKNTIVSVIINEIMKDDLNYIVYCEEYGGKARLLDTHQSLNKSRVYSGSILVIQKEYHHSFKSNTNNQIHRICDLIDCFDTNYYSNYLIMKYSSINITIKSIKDQQECIITVPSICDFQTLKIAISIVFHIHYDPLNDSIALFEVANDTGLMKPFPIKTNRRPNLEHVFTSRKVNDSTQLYFELHEGISENQMSSMLYQHIQISDGILITNSFIKLIPIDISILNLYEQLKSEGVLLNEISSYRFFTVWGAQIWEVIKPEWKLNDDSLYLRIDIIPTHHFNLNDNEFLITCSHDVDPLQITEFPPLLFKVSEDEPISELQTRLFSLYPNTNSSSWRIELYYSTAGKDIRVALKPNETLEQYRSYKSLSLDILHASVKKIVQHHTPLRIYN